MDTQEFESHRRSAQVGSREVSWVDVGEGPAVVFVHGVFVSAHLWRRAVSTLAADGRRCIAVDLPAHGQSPSRPEDDLSFPVLAKVLAEVCDAAGVDQMDLVGNDTGGALCQLFAAAYPDRVRTLTLTNCDVHENFPPEAFSAGQQLAAEGKLAAVMQSAGSDPNTGRGMLSVGYADSSALDDETVRAHVGPFADETRAREVERFVNSIRGDELVAIDAQLRSFEAPTLIVWGDTDLFFGTEWATWLRDAIPGAGEVVEVPGGRLFFVDEMADEFVAPLRRFLDEHSPAEVLRGS